MIERRYDDYLKTYRLARTGFLFLAIGLVPAAILQVLLVVGQLGDPRILFWLSQADWLDGISALTTWSVLIGVTLLWGRWEEASWQRRTTLLMIMSLIDVGIWFLGLSDKQAPGDSAWFRDQVGHALGWAEFALLASLSGAFLTHLGLEQAEESAKSTRSLAASGAVIWLMLFCERADLRAGWPIKPNPQFPRQTLLLFLGAELIATICLIQVTALVVAALRQSDRQVRDMAVEEPEEDSFTLPTEPDRTLDFADDAERSRVR
jgi:hypothetical protein